MAGFAKPTTTQTPDALLDYWLTRLTGAELRVLLYAVRRTYGFGRDEDAIGLEQFLHGITTRDGTVLDEGTGLSRRALLYAIKSLAEKGLLHKIRRVDDEGRDTVSTYRLTVSDARHPRPAVGLREVNTTQVPDDVFDYWLPRLSDAELKVLLYIVRRTLGFKKQADAIRPVQFLAGVRTRAGDQLDDGCGVSEKHLYRALAGLKEKGLITIHRRVSARVGNLASLYTLVFENELPGILRPASQLDPRARDYRLDEDETVTARPLGRPAAQGCNEDREGVQESQGGRATRTERVDTTGQAGVQEGLGEGAATTGTERSHDGKGSLSTIAPQQTDIYKERQQTGIQQTEGIDIESMSLRQDDRERRPDWHDTGAPNDDAVATRMRALVTEFGDAASPRANVTKAQRVFRESGVPTEVFTQALDDVADLVRQYRPEKPMAYFFTALENLLRVWAERRLPAPEGWPVHTPATITETDDAWRAVLEEMQLTLTADNYVVWLAPTRVLAADGHVRRIGVPSAFHKTWLERKFLRRLYQCLDRRGFPDVELVFVVSDPEAV